jgi:SAM-dependent methyltransferase
MRVADLERDMSDVIPTASSRDSAHLFERMTQATLDATRAAPGALVLDAAGGLGQDSRSLAVRGACAICAEPSRRMEALGQLLDARERVAPLWVRAWSEALPFADSSFDAAFCKGALDHFDDPGRAVAELARVVRPGGRVVLAVANFASLGCRAQRWLDRLSGPRIRGRRSYHVPSDHLTRYDPELLREQLQAHLVIEEWLGVSLLWGVRAWIALLSRLPEASAAGLLRSADALARRFPALADVLIVSGRPRTPGPNAKDSTPPARRGAGTHAAQ